LHGTPITFRSRCGRQNKPNKSGATRRDDKARRPTTRGSTEAMRGKRPLRVRQRHVRSQRKTLFVWKGFRARPLFVTRGWTPMTVRFAVKPKRCKHLSFNSRQRNALWSMHAMRGWSGVEENEEKRWGRVGATSTRAARMPRAAHLAHLARVAHLRTRRAQRNPRTWRALHTCRTWRTVAGPALTRSRALRNPSDGSARCATFQISG